MKKKLLSLLLAVSIVMTVFTAGCTKNVTATFLYLDGKTADKIVTVKAGEQVAAPEDPVAKAGYTFKGWFNADGDTEVKFPCTLSKDTVFYAEWDLIAYTITYDKFGDGSEISTAQFNVESQNIQLQPPQNIAGMTFLGWYTNQAYEGNPVISVPKGTTGDKIFYGKWDVAVIYTLTFIVDGATYATKEFSQLPAPAFPANPTPAQHYRFSGWSEILTGGTLLLQPNIGLRDYTLYAQFAAIQYNITYEIGAGSWVGSAPQATFTAVGTPFTLPTNLSRNDYLFDGWYLNAEYTGTEVKVVGFGTDYTSDIKVHAKWKARPIETIISDINYTTNGGTLPGDAPVYYEEGTEVMLPIPGRTGYDFLKWTATNNSEAPAVDRITAADTGDKMFYAWWSIINYNVTYILNGGELSGTVTYTYNVNTDYPAGGVMFGLPGGVGDSTTWGRAAKHGYYFGASGTTDGGWYKTPTFDAGTRATNVPRDTTGDLTFYAKWIVRPCSYTYHYNDGRSNVTLSFTIESPTITLEIPVRTNYNFLGWYDNQEFTGSPITAIETGTFDADGLHFYAKWQGFPFTVNYDVNGVGASLPAGFDATQNYEVGQAAFMPVPTRSGYSFGGWYALKANADNPSSDSRLAFNRFAAEFYSVTATTYYAKWITGTTSTNLLCEAEYTNLENPMVDGTGFSGSASGIEMINHWTSASGSGYDASFPNGYAVGWLHGTGITITFVVYSDRYVTGATLRVCLGVEFAHGDRSYFDSSNLIFAVNGTTVNYTNNLPVPGGGVNPTFTVTQLNVGVTMLPGANIITMTTAGNISTADTWGPELDYIRVNANSSLVWDPLLSNLNQGRFKVGI